MSKSIHTLRLQRLQGRIGEVAYQITRSHFADFQTPATWKPAANAYRCPNCVRVCLDLAGIDPASVELEIAPERLVVRGRRDLPEPDDTHADLQVLVMEIDHGDFQREFHFSSAVDPQSVRLKTNNGLLWVHLTLRSHG